MKKDEIVGAFRVEVKLGGSKTHLFINGTEVNDGGSFGLGKEGKIELRAALFDSRRKQAHGYIGKSKVGSIDIKVADDYNLSYSNGSYVSGEIAWKGPSVDTDTEGVTYELRIMPAR
ncbi:hypothetical protein BH11MYX3_BH11MYX3_08940 [soil metagenome]